MELSDNDLSTACERIRDALRARLPIIVAVDTHCPWRDAEAVPKTAVYLESGGFEEADPAFGGTIGLEVTFYAHCVMRVREGAELEVQNLAALVLKLVKNQRWGLDAELPTELRALPSVFRPRNSRQESWEFESWVVEWKQILRSDLPHLIEEDFVPATVYAAEAPQIGLAHREKYEKVVPEA